jgi:mono/diheme cytochrome c family protein
MLAALWHNDLRHYLILLNAIAFSALIAYLVVTVLSPKRTAGEQRTAPNLTPFYADEDLEGRRLERVQGWALVFAAITAIALPIYWLREPTRQTDSEHYFDKNAAHRGAVLFANSAGLEYDSASSLQCANCHGAKGDGGTAPFTVNGQKVAWKAPALNTELLRFTEDEVRQIITFGRQGTPMQPWGVEGGGPKNAQAVDDLIAYIKSIQLTSEQAQAQELELLDAAGKQPTQQVATARATLETDTLAFDEARAALRTALTTPGASDAELDAQCKAIETQVTLTSPKELKDKASACGDYRDASTTVTDDTAALAWAIEWQKRRANVTEGQLLFELNCARCHTGGWSIFNPAAAPGTSGSVDGLGPAGGGGGLGGGIGFNLRAGEGFTRFGADPFGFFDQVKFVRNGSKLNDPYGHGGIGSGRMPGFAPDADQGTLGHMLTSDQISAIVWYERNCLDVTVYTGVTPVCATDASVWPTTTVAATTSTTAAKG